MRLSDAIALGRHLIEVPDECSYCRCAIGMGLAAVGESFHLNARPRSHVSLEARENACEKWPWLLGKSDAGIYWYREISEMFCRVDKQLMTLDELIDRVRAAEPPEPESAVTEPVLTLEEELASIT